MVHAVVLVALLPLLYRTRSPRLCAGLFATAAGVWAVALLLTRHASASAWVIDVAVTSAAAVAYYGSLAHLKAGTTSWGVVAAAGVVVMLMFFG